MDEYRRDTRRKPRDECAKLARAAEDGPADGGKPEQDGDGGDRDQGIEPEAEPGRKPHSGEEGYGRSSMGKPPLRLESRPENERGQEEQGVVCAVGREALAQEGERRDREHGQREKRAGVAEHPPRRGRRESDAGEEKEHHAEAVREERGPEQGEEACQQ